MLVSYRTLGYLHPVDGEVVVVDRRPPPDELDAHRRRAAVEVVGLDLPRPPAAAHREGKVDQRADDQKDDRRRQSRLVKFLPVEWLVDVPLAVASQARNVEDDTPNKIEHRVADKVHEVPRAHGLVREYLINSHR